MIKHYDTDLVVGFSGDRVLVLSKDLTTLYSYFVFILRSASKHTFYNNLKDLCSNEKRSTLSMLFTTREYQSW